MRQEKIIIKDGLLWYGNTKWPANIIGVTEADYIAQANGFTCVERMIKAYPNNTSLMIDKNRVIFDENREN